jgi:hypothetical protein
MATQLIIPCHPAVGCLIPPRVKRLQALRLARVIPYLLGYMACLASLLVPCPVLRQRQAEVDQGMVVARDVPHEDADLAVVNLAPVAAPLALHSYRMRLAFGEATGIEGDDPIGFPQLLDHLPDQYAHQRAMVLNQATQHWYTGSTHKRVISMRLGHRVYESRVD